MLLAPGTPMLFQGQEFAASTPFYYFADHFQNLLNLFSKDDANILNNLPVLQLQKFKLAYQILQILKLLINAN